MIFEIVVIARVLVLTNKIIYIYKKITSFVIRSTLIVILKKKVENPDGIIICVSVSVFQ